MKNSDFLNNLESNDLYKFYSGSPYRSVKHSNYFKIYEDLLSKYRGREIVFVEVGIHNGGSLFMWRKFFGESARIIGIDLNPEAKIFEDHGFEIFIGSQSDSKFWKNFYKEVGKIDILLDDGGHTYDQQIITVNSSVENINNAGMIIIEDTHTSYFKKFGYPTKYSFINWIKKLIDNINSRSNDININNALYSESIFSIEIFDSIVALKIDRVNSIKSFPTSNNSKTLNFKDFRFSYTKVEKIIDVFNNIERKLYDKRENNYMYKIVLKLNSIVSQNFLSLYNYFKNKKMRRFF